MVHNVAEVIRLMLVTDDDLLEGKDLVASALAAERGGVTSVQVRLKRATARELAEAVRALVQALHIPVLVNDRPDIAIATGAAGVHLGPEDISVELARRVAPPGFLIGASVGSEAEAASAAAADYWGIGPWRSTGTKADAGVALGADGFMRLVQRAGAVPAIAIGGVTPEDVPVVLRHAGKGVAVVSGILAAPDVEAAARKYVEAWATAPQPRHLA
jgi:thiamine-phosphate pyrophosphorylase